MRTLKCKWCDEDFEVPRRREYNARKYCCPLHAYYARQEQNKKWQRWFRSFYRDVLSGEQLWGRGSEGLGPHREKDFKEELKKIKQELREKGLR